eukprot:scaffold13461_cov166-Amphora_coffeaeformis.AAC.4
MSKDFKGAHHSSSGVPIPSFESFGSRSLASSSAPILPASPTTTTAPTTTEETSKSFSSPSHTKLLSDLSDSERNSILHYSNAVEMQLYRLHARRRIPLHVCYDLMEKTLGLSLPVLPKNEVDWKNEKEMFLYKFLYVTTTAQLYEIHCEKEESSSSLSGGRRGSSRWYLQQCTPQEGNRKTLNDVRAVLFDPSRPISPRSNQQLRLAVLSLRPKEAPAKQQLEQPCTVQEADTALPAKKEGLTVEERVRAKHQARLLREETRIANETPNASRDETWRLRVGDILWHQSRQVLHRHEKFASPKRKRSSSSCSFILGDVVQLITEQSGVTGTKLTRRQIVELLQDLCREVPEWIRRSAAKQDASKDWDRNDTLWIHPIDYQEVRLRLLGKVSTSCVAKGPLKLLGSLTTSTKVEEANIASEMLAKKRTRPDTILPNAKRELWKDAPRKDPSSPPENKKIRKDMGPIGTRSTSPASPPKKRLRVNPHLILSDADHQGGDIIVPSQHDSPRGLKNLFRQLNSGKRI